jgi:hypothetical protein
MINQNDFRKKKIILFSWFLDGTCIYVGSESKSESFRYNHSLTKRPNHFSVVQLGSENNGSCSLSVECHIRRLIKMRRQ